MADDLHRFITSTLWLRLKDDVRDFRVFNRQDLFCAAYFHIRRLLLVKSGWSCRADVPLLRNERQRPLPDPNLALFWDGKLRALVQLEFHLTSGMAGGFPAAAMNERMTSLRQAIAGAEHPQATDAGGGDRGYLVAVYASEEEWFYPDRTVWENQSCTWLPVNCRTFADYADWHQRWERLAKLSD